MQNMKLDLLSITTRYWNAQKEKTGMKLYMMAETLPSGASAVDSQACVRTIRRRLDRQVGG